MLGRPQYACSNFRRPLLRQCYPPAGIDWRIRLGHGRDGVVYEVKIGGRIFALKVFWDNKPPDGLLAWAIQIECNDSTEPIYLNPEPKTFQDALANLHAFSDEGRRKQRFRDTPGAIPYSSAPRLRQCFGWTKVSGKELYALRREMWPPRAVLGGLVREIRPSEEYYAIVYELIPQDQPAMDVHVTQSQLDFFWLVGFCFVPMRLENWAGPGMLLDMADIICPWHAGWFKALYRRFVVTNLSSD
ncbi:hypothetical protein GGS23DRAFT_613950 [Durotheca rogersii]|uniref:uncharacterized protein n=1 Tax=Durotheca rogersii TaxID=419775 RepID=UPI0022208AE3|nr:uncharacterized protein GGS23DRAFT_613950 [Durotheca rogersii]KAI5860387.1 hypothetical protein GGS23DRAFT_613950 [Durotheca rogersii]